MRARNESPLGQDVFIVESSDAQLARPEKARKLILIIGYWTAISGGVLGIIIGSHLMRSNKSLSDGREVPRYDESSRNHGRFIFWMAVSILALCILLFSAALFFS